MMTGGSRWLLHLLACEAGGMDETVGVSGVWFEADEGAASAKATAAEAAAAAAAATNLHVAPLKKALFRRRSGTLQLHKCWHL